MEPGHLLRSARRDAGITQAELAQRAGTTQAAIARVESGRISPTVRTLEKLMAAAGRRLEFRASPVKVPTAEEHAKVSRGLVDVLALAEQLPSRPSRTLRYPRLPG